MTSDEQPRLGFPIHLRDDTIQFGALTRCGLFTKAMHTRVLDALPTANTTNTANPADAGGGLRGVDCFDCLCEGPANAFVVLGQLIERRSPVLADYLFAVVYCARLVDNHPGWKLRCWATDLQDATFMHGQLPASFTPQVLPVRFASTINTETTTETTDAASDGRAR